MGVLILRCLVNWRKLSGADVQAPWHGMLETVWLLCNKALVTIIRKYNQLFTRFPKQY